VSPQGLYTYPDVIVVCGEPNFADGSTDTLLNPIVLIEVLSPSTEGHDRGFKAAQYRMIESLQEYALVSQTEPRVEIFRRQLGGAWLLTEAIGLEALCRFESLDCSIAMKDVYAKVTFGGEDEIAS
jgi:Uma2 family endonuclease